MCPFEGPRVGRYDQEELPIELARRVTPYKHDTGSHIPSDGSLGGMHLQHLLDDAGNRHAGETVVALVIALLVFVAAWYGARFQAQR